MHEPRMTHGRCPLTCATKRWRTSRPWNFRTASYVEEVHHIMRIPKRTLVLAASGVTAISLLAVGLVAVHGATHAESSGTHYVVAFSQASGLPNNVDAMVSAAGGTIITRMPEIGGLEVASSNVNF